MSFDRALEIVLEHEGGYVNHPDDPGGETKYGISKRAYPYEDIKGLTLEKASLIYKRDYWDRCRCGELPWPLSLCVFDSAVNQGVVRATMLLQRAVNAKQDGVIGPVTLSKARQAGPDVSALFMAERAIHYASLPTFNTFGRGWMRRLFKISMEQ